jgi:hypothetical protein
MKGFPNVLQVVVMGLLLSASAAPHSQDRGGLLDAGRVALDDYSAELKRERSPNPAADQDFLNYVLDIEHYAVGLAYSAKGIEVEIILRQRPGQEVLGGGGHYLIDPNSLKILDKRLYE